MDRRAWRATVHGVAGVGHDLVTKPPPHLTRKSVCRLDLWFGTSKYKQTSQDNSITFWVESAVKDGKSVTFVFIQPSVH